MATIDFTGTNGQAISAVSDFTIYSGTGMEVDTNRVKASDGSLTIATIDNVVADAPISAVIDFTSTGGDLAYLCKHFTSSGAGLETFVGFGIREDGSLRLFKFVNGAATLLDSSGGSVTTDDPLFAEITNVGDVYTATLTRISSGGVITTLTGSAPEVDQTSTVAALRVSGTNPRYDDFTYTSTLSSETVTITTPDYSPYQHINDAFTVPLEFSYTGTFTQVDYSTDGGATYTTVTPSILSGGNGVVDIPLTTGQYDITLRANTATNDSPSNTVNYITVGDGFGVAIAQSNGEGVYDNAQVYTRGANDLRAVLYTVNTESFVEMRDHYSDDAANGSWVMRHAHHHIAITGRPCFYVPCPESGTSIEDWQKTSTRLFSGVNLYNRSLARLTAVPVGTIITQQGERNSNDAHLNPDGFPSIRESYADKFDQVLTDFVTDLPYIPKFIVQPLHDMSTASYQDANKDLIRLAQLDVVSARSDVEVSMPLTDFVFGLAGNDGTHFNTDAQADALGRRLAIAWATYNLGVEGTAPVVSALPDRTIELNTPTTLSGTATDADGSPVSLEVLWAVISGTGALSANNILEPTITLTDTDVTILQRVVHDGRNLIIDTLDVSTFGTVSIQPTLIGRKHKTVILGDTYADEGILLTDENGNTQVQFADTPFDLSVANRTAYSYTVAGWSTLNRRVNVEAVNIVAPDNVYELDGGNSWWMNSVATVHNGLLIRSFSDMNGDQGIAEFDAVTRKLINYRYLETALYPEDEHNAIAHLVTSTGRLILLWTSHGRDVDNNQIGIYHCCEAASGRIADLNSPIELDLNIQESNYSQIFEMANGEIWALGNDDIGATWTPFQRTGVNTWVDRTPLFRVGSTGGGSAQSYGDAVSVGNELRVFGMIHANNLRNNIVLMSLDIPTGDVFNSTGAAVGNISSGDADSNSILTTSSMATVRIPALGRSNRLIWVARDGLAFIVADYDNLSGSNATDGNNGKYVYCYNTNPADVYDVNNWSEIDICSFDDDSYLDKDIFYVGGASVAEEVVNGVGINVSRKNGAAWTIERFTTPNPATTAFTGEVVHTASNGNKLIRPVSPIGATNRANVVYAEGTFTTFKDYDYASTVLEWDTPSSNTAPTASAGPNQTGILAGATIQFDFSGSAVTTGGATITSYNLTQPTGDAVTIIGGNAIANPTAVAPTTGAPQTLGFSLTVTDSNGLTSTASALNIGVLAQNQTITKNVTFDLPTEIVGQSNMLYTLQLLAGGASIANGTLDTSATTVTINIDSVGSVSNGTPLYLEARNLTTSNGSTAIGFAGTENAVVVTS